MQEKSLLQSLEKSLPDLKTEFRIPAREPADKAANAKLAQDFVSASEMGQATLESHGLPLDILTNTMYSKMPQVMGRWFTTWKSKNLPFSDFGKHFYREFLDQITLEAFTKYLGQFDPIEGNTLLATARELKQYIDPALSLIIDHTDKWGAKAIIFNKIKTIMGPVMWNTLVLQGAKLRCLEDVIEHCQKRTGKHDMTLQALPVARETPAPAAIQAPEPAAVAARPAPANPGPNRERPQYQRGQQYQPNRGYQNRPGGYRREERREAYNNQAAGANAMNVLFEGFQKLINQTGPGAANNSAPAPLPPPPVLSAPRADTGADRQKPGEATRDRKALIPRKDGPPPPCSLKEPCDYCEIPGHNSFQCTRRTMDYALAYPEGVPCLLCGTLPGHYVYECNLCTNCRQSGHFRKACPYPNQRRQNNPGNGRRAPAEGP